LSYSGQWELTQAAQRIAQKVSEGRLRPEEITQATVADHLDTAGIPDPELMIRTSGEFRISNFLLWQLAYTELYFTEVLWPDFRKEDLFAAIEDYQKRERRFGKTGEQVKP
jgi:undecaprenyl diphosphate synthase